VIWLLLASAFAQDVRAVPQGDSRVVHGPAVTMPEETFTEFLRAREQLPICRSALDEATKLGVAANRRAVDAYGIAREQFAADALLAADLNRQVAELAGTNVQLEMDIRRTRNQRNVAWAVAGGMVSGAVVTTLVVLN